MRKLPIPFPLVANIDDHTMVRFLLQRAEKETDQFLYGKEYGTFLSFYRYYYVTGCANVEDFTQTIYLHIISPGRNKQSPLETFKKKLHEWLYSVCNNFCIDKYRKHRKVKFCSFEEMIKYLDDDALAVVEVDEELVSLVLQRMTNERFRQILRYRYMDDMEPEEIARTFGVERSRIDRDTYRAKEQFRKVLQKTFPEFYNDCKKNNKKK